MTSENNSPNILLVEDDPLVAFVLRNMLEEMGYIPDIAQNGKEAIALSATGYDLIFMDIGLPDMDGIQVAAKIRTNENNKIQNRSHIIALTAYNIEELRDKCFAIGIDDIAPKPIEYDDLQHIIRKFCAVKS